MVIRDLLVYAEVHDASVLHYSDDSGLEADAVYQLPDGRYALIEIKTGINEIPTAEKGLLKFVDMIREYNKKALADPKHPRADMFCPNEEESLNCADRPLLLRVACQRESVRKNT